MNVKSPVNSKVLEGFFKGLFIFLLENLKFQDK
jgi:hypothetical protein